MTPQAATVLNNREVASLIWLGILSIWVLVVARSNILGVLRAFFAYRLAALWMIYVAVITGAVFCVRQVGVRYEGGTKDAVLWAVFAGLPLLARFGVVARSPTVLLDVLRAAAGLTVLVEFFVNLYVFPLPMELLLQPFMVLLALSGTVAGAKPGLAPAKRLVDRLQVTLGLGVLCIVAWQVIFNRAALDPRALSLALVQPVLLTGVVVALTFLVALYSAYEMVATHMRIAPPRGPARPDQLLALASVLHGRVGLVSGFAGYLPRRLKAAPSFAAARRLALDYKRGATGRADVPAPTCPSHAGSTHKAA